jgi:hypothetical protein
MEMRLFLRFLVMFAHFSPSEPAIVAGAGPAGRPPPPGVGAAITELALRGSLFLLLSFMCDCLTAKALAGGPGVTGI